MMKSMLGFFCCAEADVTSVVTTTDSTSRPRKIFLAIQSPFLRHFRRKPDRSEKFNKDVFRRGALTQIKCNLVATKARRLLSEDRYGSSTSFERVWVTSALAPEADIWLQHNICCDDQ